MTAPAGNLALIDYQPVTSAEPTEIRGIPATVALIDSFDGVRIDAEPAAGVAIDGRPVDGPTNVARLRPDGTPLITHGTLTVDVFSLDGNDYELRIYDANATNRSRFAGIDVWDEDQRWRLTGHFDAYTAPEQVPWPFTRAIDSGHTKSVPGTLNLTVGDVDYELLTFLDGPALVLVFADGTTGTESYAPGRFLRIPAPDEHGTVEVDLNRAFIPPCGFSDFYSCPLPPASNRIAVPVRAGEKKVLWSDDHDR